MADRRVLLAALAMASAACRAPAADPGLQVSLVALPNSWSVVVTGERVIGLDANGLRRWTAFLPKEDRITTPIAAAADGTIYLRGRRAIHALSADGKWRWKEEAPRLPAELPPEQASIYGPAAMTDSTVAMITEPDELTAYTGEGDVRWRRELPNDARAVATPRCAPSGQIIVPTTAGVVAFSPTGHIDWQAARW